MRVTERVPAGFDNLTRRLLSQKSLAQPQCLRDEFFALTARNLQTRSLRDFNDSTLARADSEEVLAALVELEVTDVVWQ